MAWKNVNSGEQLRLRGFKQCIMQIQKTCMTPNIDANSGVKRGIKRKGTRCKRLVAPEAVQLYGAPVCAMHVPHYVALLKSSVEHDRKRRARLDPGCDVD